MPDVTDISHIAYELYKTDWLNENTDANMRLQAARDYATHWLETTTENPDEEVDSFEDFIFETGYGQGSIYVCYEEFCDAEYHDKNYICGLLQDEKLIARYYADIDNDDGEP